MELENDIEDRDFVSRDTSPELSIISDVESADFRGVDEQIDDLKAIQKRKSSVQRKQKQGIVAAEDRKITPDPVIEGIMEEMHEIHRKIRSQGRRSAAGMHTNGSSSPFQKPVLSPTSHTLSSEDRLI